jgi:acyl carrier protein
MRPAPEPVAVKSSGDHAPTIDDRQGAADTPAASSGNGKAPASPAPVVTLVPAPAPVAVAPTPQPVAVAAPPAPQPAEDHVTAVVLQIVAEKTGYPQDMLDLDLDLEADLGVDTVKQAETFAAVRAAFDIPRKDDLKLRDYPTLASVIQFVHDSRPDLAANSQRSAVSSQQSANIAETTPITVDRLLPTADPVTEQVLAIVAEKTGYPTEMLDLDLDLEADLGVDTVKQAETFAAVRAAFDIPRQDTLKLRDYPTLAAVIQFVRDNRPDLAQPTTDDRRPTTDEGGSTA